MGLPIQPYTELLVHIVIAKQGGLAQQLFGSNQYRNNYMIYRTLCQTRSLPRYLLIRLMCCLYQNTSMVRVSDLPFCFFRESAHLKQPDSCCFHSQPISMNYSLCFFFIQCPGSCLFHPEIHSSTHDSFLFSIVLATKPSVSLTCFSP